MRLLPQRQNHNSTFQVEFETSGIVGDEGAKMHAAGAMSASTAGNLQVTGSIQHNTLSFSLSRGLRSFFFVSRMPNAGNSKKISIPLRRLDSFSSEIQVFLRWWWLHRLL